ncbi:alpha-N-arabinofuranosidase [candidate division KSB1 bacterium]|nr:alpha-N-arabinofuranosidase [candidate division KSB1 bacterium]
MKLLTILSTFLLLFGMATLFAANPNKVTINADQGKHQINRHIYGHFAEHLGRCIYGGFYVGEGNTKIPNTAGIRNDVIEALKNLNIPNLRWPGGCFADTYHWKDGVGPKQDRPSFVNRWWGGVIEDNSFGTHDFLNLCEAIGAEPYLAANVGSGTVQELIDWVYYVNHKEGSPMANLRKTNGREEPWNVKFWGVGNEMWGCGGNMKPEYYADELRKYSTFMTDWSNSDGLFRIASGASEDDYNWTETLMKEVPGNLIEGMALHSYSVIDWRDKGPATGFSEDHYFKTMQVAYKMKDRVEKHSAIMDKYDPDKKLALVVDEWGGWYDVEPGTNPGFLYQQNTIRDAMIAGVTLNIFNNNCERVRMANLAQTINVLQAVMLTEKDGTRMVLTPTYHVMEMYKVHQDATLLPAEVETSNYKHGDATLPAIHVSASKDKSGKIHISLTNIDPNNAAEVECELLGAKARKITGRILTAKALDAHNTFEKPDNVKPAVFKDAKLDGQTIKVKMPSKSVVVLEVE